MKKLYLYNPNHEVKNIFVTEVEAGPHDIIDNSTEKTPLPEVDGFHVVFDLTKDNWIYRINLRKKFYDPTNGQVIDNELNPEFAKHTLEDFGVKSVDELVTTPPPEMSEDEVDEISKSYFWSYEESKWMLNVEKYKETALERLQTECGNKISDLTKGVPDDEVNTYKVQYEEAKKYKNATPEEKDTEVEIKVLVPSLYTLVKSRFDLDDDFDEFKEYLEDKIEKIISRGAVYNDKVMKITGTYQAYNDKMSKLKLPSDILDLYLEFKNLNIS